MARAVAEPSGIARTERDVVRAGATFDRLVEVVAHREVVGEVLEVRRVTLGHVVESHRAAALGIRDRIGCCHAVCCRCRWWPRPMGTGGSCSRSGCPASRGARCNRAAATSGRSDARDRRVRVVRNRRRERVGSRRQRVHVRGARVGVAGGETRTAREQERHVVSRQVVLDGCGDLRRRDVRRRRAAHEGGRKRVVVTLRVG